VLAVILALSAFTSESVAARRKRGKKKAPAISATQPTQDPGFADNLANRAGETEATEEEELAPDDEGEEPEEDSSRTFHYVPKDGRNPLTLTGGFAAIMRTTSLVAADGTPPYYQGALSPGITVALSLYPWRFREGGGLLRDLGVNARASFAWMSAAVVDAPNVPVRTDLFYAIRAGFALRHVFGERESSVAFGAEIGVAVDAMKLAPELLMPAAAYVSPSATLLLEVPVANKYLVWATRAGVMPVSAVTSAQVQAYGARKFALGMDVITGFRSTLLRNVLYAEANAMLTHYWHEYSGTGSEGFRDVVGRDLILGISVALGVTY
jgi:hypothetical protein